MDNAVLLKNQDNFWKELSSQIIQLSLVTSVAFNTIALAIVNKDYRLPLPNLEEAISAATDRLENIQQETQSNYSVDELLRFFTFFYGMEEVAQKLQKLSGKL